MKRTSLSLRGDTILKVGAGGSLKAMIDELRKQLKGEGLFDADHKLPLPEFPKTIGLICAPQARAEGDVITNVNLRWPSVTFKVVHVHVQGEQCPAEVVQAIAQLDADPSVDVIIVARGGGSFEDLIGFSDERVVRAAYACTTPLISSIGHEDDWTLLDLVADLRAPPLPMRPSAWCRMCVSSRSSSKVPSTVCDCGSVRAWRTRFDLSRDMRTARA